MCILCTCTRARVCINVYILLYTYIYETTNTSSCIRRWHTAEMSFARRQTTLSTEIRRFAKVISGMLHTCQQATAWLHYILFHTSTWMSSWTTWLHDSYVRLQCLYSWVRFTKTLASRLWFSFVSYDLYTGALAVVGFYFRPRILSFYGDSAKGWK